MELSPEVAEIIENIRRIEFLSNQIAEIQHETTSLTQRNMQLAAVVTRNQGLIPLGAA